MAVRTFGRTDWRAADAAWAEGEFDPAWSRFRELAQRRGFIYPPSGSRHDTWDENPSQRAILWRAIEETPDLLARCIVRADSWHAVVDLLTRARDEWRRTLAEVDVEDNPAPSPREAAEALRSILGRLS